MAGIGCGRQTLPRTWLLGFTRQLGDATSDHLGTDSTGANRWVTPGRGSVGFVLFHCPGQVSSFITAALASEHPPLPAQPQGGITETRQAKRKEENCKSRSCFCQQHH